MGDLPRLLTPGDRPASVLFRGGTVCIHVHDEWYLRQLTRIKADLKALHPDADRRNRRRITGRAIVNGASFKQLVRSAKFFLKAQAHWYAAFRLKPPKYRHVDVGPLPLLYNKSPQAVTAGYRSPVARAHRTDTDLANFGL